MAVDEPTGVIVEVSNGATITPAANAGSQGFQTLGTHLGADISLIGMFHVDAPSGTTLNASALERHDDHVLLVEHPQGYSWLHAAAPSLELPAGTTAVAHLALSTPPAGRSAVHLRSDDLREWERIDEGRPAGLPSSRSPRILVVVHGFASTTLADFGLLAATGLAEEALDVASIDYDAVVGFDDDSARSPIDDNGRHLGDTLKSWSPTGEVEIDAIAVGRGLDVMLTALDQLGDDVTVGTVLHLTGDDGDDVGVRIKALVDAAEHWVREHPPGSERAAWWAAAVAAAARAARIEPPPPAAAPIPSFVEQFNLPAAMRPVALLDRSLIMEIAHVLELSGMAQAAQTAHPPRMQPSAPGPEPQPAPPPPPSATRGPTADRADPGSEHDPADPDLGRFVQAVIIHDGQQRQTFVAGEQNVLRCWIGPPPQDDDPVAVSDTATPELGMEVELMVELTVNMEVVDSQRLILPKSASARSGDCDFDVSVDLGDMFILGQLAFTVDGRMFELVQLQVKVLSPSESEDPDEKIVIRSLVSKRDVIDLTDRSVSASSIVVDTHNGSPHLRVFGSGAGGAFDLSGKSPLVAFLADELFRTTKRLVRRHGDDHGSDVEDDEWTKLLRTAAKHGSVLHRSLIRAGFADPGARVEVLNLDSDEYVPIEFLYDRGAPADDATIKAGCFEAMAAGADDCGLCHTHEELTDAERDANPHVCPFGFWSMRKIIERHHVLSNGTTGTTSPRDGENSLPSLSSVLCGWSAKIREEDINELTIDLTSSAPSLHLVDGWDDWKASLNQDPSLLVALPHHEKGDDLLGSLELGGEELGLEQALDLYVRTGAPGPGPVLLLLGCETDDADTVGHPSFAREFNAVGAPVVIATLSKVLGRHAAPFAGRLVQELVAADAETDIGAALLTVRRAMFAEGYLMALAVIALGDGDWKLSASVTSP